MLHHDTLRRLLVALVFLLALSWGYLFGRWLALPNTPLSFQPDLRPLISTVHIQGVRNGNLEGKLIGSGRLIIGDEPILANADGTFSINADDVLKNRISIVVPEWAQFVASKRGKRYYPVFSAAGSALKVQNRVYFATEQGAEKAGYLR